MKNIKKIVIAAAIICLAICAALLIGTLFGFKLEGWVLKILLTSSTIALGCTFSINSLNLLEKNNKIGWVGIGFISVSATLALVNFWVFALDGKIFQSVVFTLCLATLFVCTIISHAATLKKNFLVLQLFTYIFLFALSIFAAISFFDFNLIFGNGALFKIFIILAIICASLLIILSITHKRQSQDIPNTKYNTQKKIDSTTQQKEEFITITLAEYGKS